MERKRLAWLLLMGGLLVLGGMLLTLSGCGRAEALDTLYEGEGPTIITYDEAYEMLEAGKTFFYYEGYSFDIAGESADSKMLDRVFKENDVNYFIIDRDRGSVTPELANRLYSQRLVIGFVHAGEVHRGEQSYGDPAGMTNDDIERGIDKDVAILLTLVEN